MFKKNVYLAILLTCFISSVSAENLILLTQNSAPFNYVKRGKTIGITVDLAKEMFKKANLPFSQEDIVVDTLSSVLTQAMTTPNSILLTTVRMPAREKLMQWIGPVADIRLVLVAKKASKVNINSANDFKKYKIATFKNTGPESALIKKGAKINDLMRVSTPKQAYKMLDYDRVQVVAAADLPFLFNLIKRGKNLDDYEIVYTIKKVKFYMGVNLDTPKSVVQKLQKALDEIKKPDSSGKSKYDRIMDKYFTKGKSL